MFELVEPGNFIERCSPPNALETFFIAEILSKAIADYDMCDKNGYFILLLVNNMRKCVTYKKEMRKKEWFITNVLRKNIYI